MFVHLKSIGFEHPNGEILFQNIQFSVSSFEKAGLVGPNGIGKSTLARIIAGELLPTEGFVSCDGAVHYFPQMQSAPTLTAEDYLLSIWQDIQAQHRLLAQRLIHEIDLRKSCEKLSGGEWMRVRLTKFLAHQADLLILDEPTNNLDGETRIYFHEFVERYQNGLLLISHDRSLLQKVDTILEMSNQGIQSFGGDWDFYELQSQNERKNLEYAISRTKASKFRAEEKRTEMLYRQKKRMQKGQRDALTSGDPKIILGARKRKAQKTLAGIDEKTQNRIQERLEDQMQALRKLKSSPKIYAEFPETEVSKSRFVFELKDINIKHESSSSYLWKDHISFRAEGPIKLLIKGKNGAGKSSVLKLLSQTLQDFKVLGEVKLGSVKVVYLDQNLSLIDKNLSVLENLQKRTRLDKNDLRNTLAQFLFQNDQVYQLAATLSGGEKLRLGLCLALMDLPPPQLLILDEPTNNIDVLNIEFLEELINKYRGALIVVSHDDKFVQSICITDVLDLDRFQSKGKD